MLFLKSIFSDLEKTTEIPSTLSYKLKKKINLLDTIRDHIIRANKEKKLDWDIFPYIFSEWKVFFSDDYRKISENNYN